MQSRNELVKYVMQAFMFLLVVAVFGTFGACIDYYVYQRTIRVYEIHVKPTLVTSAEPTLEELAEVGYGTTGTLFERADENIPLAHNPRIIKYRKGDWMPTTGPIHVFVYVGLVFGGITGFIIIVGVNSEEEPVIIRFVNMVHAKGVDHPEVRRYHRDMGSENKRRAQTFIDLFALRDQLVSGHGQFNMDQAPGWTYRVVREPTKPKPPANKETRDGAVPDDNS